MNARNKLRSCKFRGYYGGSSARGDGWDIISIREHQLEGTSISPLSRCMLEVTLLKLRPLIEPSSEFKDVRINAAAVATLCASFGCSGEIRKK